MKTKEKNWLRDNLFEILFLVVIIVGLVFWGAIGVYMFKSFRRASAEQKAVFNSFCEYVADKDIEYIEAINKGTSLYKSGGAIVKLYGEEPRTFKGLRWSTEVSTDDKYHVSIQYNNIVTVYVPLNNTVNFISK